MNAVPFDTYKVIKRLTAEGFLERQATVIVDALQERHGASNDTLATTADLSELKAELIKWMFGGFMAVGGLLVTVLVKLP